MTGPSCPCFVDAGISACHAPTCNNVLSPGLLDDHLGSPKLPTASVASSCPWQPGNTTVTGPVFAFPASSLCATCPNISQTMAYICTTATEDSNTSISNFWSTNMLASGQGQPVSRLMLDVALLDALGQRISAGTHLQHIQKTGIAATFDFMRSCCSKSSMSCIMQQLQHVMHVCVSA